MKIIFPEPRSRPFLPKIRGAGRMLALLIVFFFISASGTYLLGNNLFSLAVVVLGISGILAAAGATGLLRWRTADQARGAPMKRKAPRAASEWYYRPKEKARAFAAIGA